MILLVCICRKLWWRIHLFTMKRKNIKYTFFYGQVWCSKLTNVPFTTAFYGLNPRRCYQTLSDNMEEQYSNHRVKGMDNDILYFLTDVKRRKLKLPFIILSCFSFNRKLYEQIMIMNLFSGGEQWAFSSLLNFWGKKSWKHENS